MNDFKTTFNPLIPIFRVIISIFFFGIFCIMIYYLYNNFNLNSIKKNIIGLIIIIVFGIISQMFFKQLLKSTKNYLINDSYIDEYNFLTFKTKRISKKDIKGYSESYIPYKIGNFEQIIIYLNNGSKIEVMQFEYFNFKKIEPALFSKDYNYLGYEPYIWKWFNSRVYKYDN